MCQSLQSRVCQTKAFVSTRNKTERRSQEKVKGRRSCLPPALKGVLIKQRSPPKKERNPPTVTVPWPWVPFSRDRTEGTAKRWTRVAYTQIVVGMVVVIPVYEYVGRTVGGWDFFKPFLLLLATGSKKIKLFVSPTFCCKKITRYSMYCAVSDKIDLDLKIG